MVAFLSLPFLIIILGLLTMGAVLFVKLVMPGVSQSRRIFAASLLGPGGLVIPGLLISLVEAGGGEIIPLVAAMLGGLLFMGALCWPAALFATRRLDKLTQFDLETFE